MLVALLLSATGCNNTESVPPQNDITAEESTTDVMSDVPESTTALAPVESEMAESTSVPSSMELKKVGNMQYYLYIPNGRYYIPTDDGTGKAEWTTCIHGVGFTPSEENTIDYVAWILPRAFRKKGGSSYVNRTKTPGYLRLAFTKGKHF